MEPLELDFHFDNDTALYEGMPMVVLGESYSGELLVRNNERYQYVVLDVTPEDEAMKFEKLGDNKYIMPGQTAIIKFQIETAKSRKKPFKLGARVHGGYIL